MTKAPVKKDLALVMPLVTADKVDSPEAKAVIARVFPPAK
ncbi:ribose transport system substrate-binding protein [Rhizobium mongolense]|uniref:Ribose transport system substrate-binding protein n=1 Tax=Rhizobium mongolense TaxID=57676 RepID=A0ABR6IGQ9_9HYPH|nr:ribose transport system substrate-binding protein [Rhizobium mongolense]